MKQERITDRDLGTLNELEAANKNLGAVGFRNGWARPMDCGAWNGSHHSKTLRKLWRMGFVEMNRGPKDVNQASNSRPGILYKITPAGAERLVAMRANDAARRAAYRSATR